MSLLPPHLEMLRASGIGDEVIAARGYRSVTTKAELHRLGFAPSQQITPTLLIPIWGGNGEVVLYHHRPDQPRMKDGKIVKYEFPSGSRMAIDVHPDIREKVRDPAVPLFVTEGVKKADSAISQGLCCIALIGTWNWRGTNEFGGKTALPDWESIALKDRDDHAREVYVAYDSDVMLKPQVHQALARLSELLKQRGASVRFLYLPTGDGGCKVGLDDYLAAGHSVDDLMRLACTELLSLPLDPGRDGDPAYDMNERGIFHNKRTRDGVVPTPLANFTARIVGT